MLLTAVLLAAAGCSGENKVSSVSPSSAGAVSAASSKAVSDSGSSVQEVFITDSEGNSVTVPQDPRVISLYGSFAEAWVLSGGELVGATQDAIDERGLELSADTTVVGTVKHPNLEKILALSPDLVILSADIAPQTELTESLTNAGITWAAFRTDTFSEYKFMMQQFCAITGREDLYQTNVADVEDRINAILEKIPQDGENAPSVLLMRAFATGVKAKRDDNLAGVILKEFGCRNIADDHPSLLEDLSIEQVIADDPDNIFVSTMGDEDEALAYLQENILSVPTWSGLTAMKNGRYYVLPKELFHNKPNNRWDESYEYLAKILWPDIFGEE